MPPGFTITTVRENSMAVHKRAVAELEPAEFAGPRRGETLLNDIEYRFRLMGEGPSPLSVDGRKLGHGLPRRRIALPELSAILMHPACSYAARDEAWRLLVRRARTGDPKWRAGAVGVALPGLRFKAYLLAKLSGGDVQAAVVEHCLRALDKVEGRHREDPHRTPRTGTDQSGPGPAAERGDHRLPERQDRRHRPDGYPGLRLGEEDQREETVHRDRHPRPAARGLRRGGQRPGPRWREGHLVESLPHDRRPICTR